MRALSRNFTSREKVLLVVLSIILLGLLYFLLIDRPVRNGITEAQNDKVQLQMERDMLNLKIEQLESMEMELDELVHSDKVSIMASYNNSKEEIRFLNDILAGTLQYTVDFSGVTRDGDQIRRDFSLDFTAKNYADACEVLNKLNNSNYRCLIGTVIVSSKENDIQKGAIMVKAAATFYETMVGGIEDAGLPQS